IPGHGTVVTGSIMSGTVVVDDTLELWPSGRTVRVRGLQNHGEQQSRSRRLQRAALNLAGVHHTEVTRGNELATPGYLQPTQQILVKVRMLPDAPQPLKTRQQVTLHLATTEVLA